MFLEKILEDEDSCLAVATYNISFIESNDWDFRKAKDQYEEDLKYKPKK